MEDCVVYEIMIQRRKVCGKFGQMRVWGERAWSFVLAIKSMQGHKRCSCMSDVLLVMSRVDASEYLLNV